MEKYCGQCEKTTTHELRPLGINVGSRVLQTEVPVCKVCGAYERDRKLRKQINEWGEQLTSSFETLQPFFSGTIHDYLDHKASEFGLEKSRLVKAMYVFYLNHAVSHPQFKLVKELVEGHESSNNMDTGPRQKLGVRVSYRAFRKLETYSIVRSCTPAKGIEDAVQFCIGLKAVTDRESNDLLNELARKYKEVIDDFAMAA